MSATYKCLKGLGTKTILRTTVKFSVLPFMLRQSALVPKHKALELGQLGAAKHSKYSA